MKEKILKYIRHKPLLRRILSKIYLTYIKINNLLKQKKFTKIYYINPNEINKVSGKYFNIFKEEGKIEIGDWDISGINFKDNKIYKGLLDRFINKRKWEKTSYFKTFIKKIQNGELMWNCSNEKELLRRCKKLDKLFNDIKNNGYKLNKDLITGGYDEVTINIGRHGELLFNDGAHRLTIAKILKIKQIPIKIIARHKNWYNLIKYLKSTLPNQTSYQSLGHPDLDANFIIEHSCYNRFNLFKDYLPKSKKDSKALDIGGNVGFFTRKLEKLGFNTYIIEHESFYLNILKKFKSSLGFKYRIIGEDMFIWKGIKENKFDVVLALNIFHHFIKTKEFYKKLVNFLNNLNTDNIIFEAHNIKEEQMKNVYKNFTAIEFVNFIMKETGLNKYKRIGIIKNDGREIFKIYKD